MKSVLVATALAVSSLLAGSVSPAAAYDYTYCLQGKEFGYPGNCQFTTYQQCQLTASGTDSACGINPVVAFARQGRSASRYPAYPGR